MNRVYRHVLCVTPIQASTSTHFSHAFIFLQDIASNNTDCQSSVSVSFQRSPTRRLRRLEFVYCGLYPVLLGANKMTSRQINSPQSPKTFLGLKVALLLVLKKTHLRRFWYEFFCRFCFFYITSKVKTKKKNFVS